MDQENEINVININKIKSLLCFYENAFNTNALKALNVLHFNRMIHKAIKPLVLAI
jgi:hypothetical protein